MSHMHEARKIIPSMRLWRSHSRPSWHCCRIQGTDMVFCRRSPTCSNPTPYENEAWDCQGDWSFAPTEIDLWQTKSNRLLRHNVPILFQYSVDSNILHACMPTQQIHDIHMNRQRRHGICNVCLRVLAAHRLQWFLDVCSLPSQGRCLTSRYWDLVTNMLFRMRVSVWIIFFCMHVLGIDFSFLSRVVSVW